MPLDRAAALEVLALLAQQEQLKVTVTESAKGSVLAGLGAFLGGLLLGPVGLLIGGSAGGATGYALSAGQFRGVPLVIREDMTERQRQRLFLSVQHLVRQIDASDAALAAAALATAGQGGLRTLLLQQLVHFLTNEMSLQIAD